MNLWHKCTVHYSESNDMLLPSLALFRWWSGSVGSVVDCINEVNQHQARLALGWVTIPVCNQPPRSTQPGHPSVGRRNEYQQKLGCKQPHTRCTGLLSM